MGAVVVGYVAKPEGEAAVEQGIAEAKLRGATLIVVNSHRGGREYDDETSVQSEQRPHRARGEAQGVRASSTTSASWSAASSPRRT